MNEFPDWGGFTPERVAKELPGLLAGAEAAVSAVERGSGLAYEDFAWALDDAMRGLRRMWHAVAHMLGVCNSVEWREVDREFRPKVVEFSLRVAQSAALHARARAVRDALPAGGALAATRRRILDKMVQAAELSGVALEGKARDRFNEINMELASLSADFANSVIDATTPEIADAAYIEAMKHERDRATRERLYRKRAARAPENEPRVAAMLALRREQAEILGFPDYASLSVATKCAPSPAAVMKMVDDLDAATAAPAKREDAEIAASCEWGEVAPWDVAFLAERLRESRYSYSEEELKGHFEFNDVLRGLFRIAKFLFGVDVREVADRPSTWHEDVRFFAVGEGGEDVAHFYLDPYARPGSKQGGAWMNEFRDLSRRRDEKPLAVVVLNLKPKDGDGRTLMTMRDVETLFHEFGHALQCMLTRVGEERAAGMNLVEWDAVEVASQFMENWCLDDRTGIEIPAELKEKVKAAKNFRAASTCRRQLALTSADMLVHIDAPADYAAADAAARASFSHFGVPQTADDRFLCSFVHVFAGGYAAGYYGYKWAEVMSADCYGAFEEAGLGDDAAMARLGRAYRETLLSLGGSEDALSVFRRFRGRDPEIGALLRQQGLA